MPSLIDFRSDASTQPTPEMRRSMAEAEIGNADFGDDPTVQRLERTIAERLGKEEAVFAHSGTMANLSAVMSHVEPGETVLVASTFTSLTTKARRWSGSFVVSSKRWTMSRQTVGRGCDTSQPSWAIASNQIGRGLHGVDHGPREPLVN